ncbi:MAG: hypothetical protein JRM99_03645 [Nitrososphaerota archaeon]|nr:hypothetical protein [Nitrososphaerota archaeon]
MKVERRRGLSPIIAELLLIAITVTIGSTFFFVGSQSIGGYANGFSLLFGKSGQAAQEIYVVEYSQFVQPSNVTLTIRNVGYLPTEVADISFFNTTATTGAKQGTFIASAAMLNSTETWCTFNSPGYIQIPVGNFCTLTVTNFAWGNGATYNVVVSTERGNSIVVQEIA